MPSTAVAVWKFDVFVCVFAAVLLCVLAMAVCACAAALAFVFDAFVGTFAAVILCVLAMAVRACIVFASTFEIRV